jgi:cytochrome c-type biogenesis protein CcmH/NrfG
LVVAVVVCVAVAGVVLKRGSRPVDRPPDQPVLPAPPREKATKPPLIASVPATDQELIAQTKKIGDRLVEDFPEDPRAITLAGHICWALDEPATAVASWEKSTRLHPDFDGAWAALGMDAFRKGDFEKAAQCLQKAHRLAPDMADGDLFMMIDALMNAGRPGDVVEVLAPWRKTHAASAHAALALGLAYLQLKEYGNAKNELLEALALDPRSAKAHFATIVFCKGRTALAGTGLPSVSHECLQPRIRREKLLARECRPAWRPCGPDGMIPGAMQPEIRSLLDSGRLSLENDTHDLTIHGPVRRKRPRPPALCARPRHRQRVHLAGGRGRSLAGDRVWGLVALPGP